MATYVVNSGTAFSYAANTTKTLVNIINSAASVTKLTEFGVSMDGVTSTNIPFLVELCYSTQAGAGTPTNSPTPTQISGLTRASQATSGNQYSAEPTALTVWKHWYVHPQTGIVIQFPLGREPTQGIASDGLLLRVTNPTGNATTNVRGYMEFSEDA